MSLPWTKAPVAPDLVLRCDDGDVEAHAFILRLSSKVLDGAIEAAAGAPARAPASAAEPAGAKPLLVLPERPPLPMPGDKAKDWKLMLELLYPMLPGAPPRGGEVTWDNAERLLLLADKWDLAAVKAAVERFVTDNWKKSRVCGRAELARQLKWLSLASQAGLPALFTMLERKVAEQYTLTSGCNRGSAAWCPTHGSYNCSHTNSSDPKAYTDPAESLASMRHEDALRLLRKVLFK